VLGTEMKYNLNKNDKKKKNTIETTAKVLSLTTILVIAGVIITPPLTALGSRLGGEAFEPVGDQVVEETLKRKAAPVVVSGDNIYIAWWTNNTANNNEEVMFRASTDGGATFGDKINLSNTTNADSTRVEIAGEGDTVVVSWWETNQTSDIPVARVSNDAGETFGPLMMLAANGTLGSGEAEEIGVAGEGGGEEG
jgi:hypothetical protein